MILEAEQAEYMMGLLFCGFLCYGAWKDLRTRQIFPGFLMMMGLTGILARAAFCFICWKEQGSWMEYGADWAEALLVGGVLLVLSRLTKGALGAGDGWFFIASSAWLGAKKLMLLLMGGMILCFIFCGFVVMWGAWKRISVKNKKIPFLPFLIPAAAILLL